ncbi:reverse transcriptase domain-containing protein [Pararhodonellum marinum]|uniref:reverse transcriptase domain-containing protein n=1 Tax=Pararhodonellum marinum TaxID=2755358 RepID=UPI001E336102|nr:reverse transcriptase domain-containing protein [Pararhodonellum marinum]
MKKKKDWFKIKRYPHIGLPLDVRDRHKWIEPYITNPLKIANHRFLPFIHKSLTVRKFRKVYSEEDGKLDSNFVKEGKVLRKPDKKSRELFYASHLDSLVFSYYAHILSLAYEKKINEPAYNLSEVVNAYRSILVDPSKTDGPNKCNIDFANDAFEFIRSCQEPEFVVIAFDISSFFDNLNHKLLRDRWAEILGDFDGLKQGELPPDHFNVFKNITRFSHIDIVDIFEEFKDRIITRKIRRDGSYGPVKLKPVEKIKYLRNQNAIAFCYNKDFLKVKGKLIQPSKTKKLKDGRVVPRNFGIPQGSPISSILANIYLLKFDKVVNDFIRKKGLYRRYSDDIIVVCPESVKSDLEKLVYSEIEKVCLEIQPKKTQVFHFLREHDGRLKCGQEFDNEINWNKNLVYLGFEFDGEFSLLKSASLSGYYRKMKKYVRRAKHYSAKRYSTKNGELFKRRILKKFSYKGAKRTRKWIWNPSLSEFEKSDNYNYGNFLTYAFKAANYMKNNKIKGQIKRHWGILNKLIKS